MKQILLVAVLMFALTLTLWAEPETTTEETSTAVLAKALFEKLYAGDLSVVDQVNYEYISIFSSDYHDEYLKLTDEQEKADYKKAFVTNFSFYCQELMLEPQDLGAWKVCDEDEADAVVSAEWEPSDLILLFGKVGNKLVLWDLYQE